MLFGSTVLEVAIGLFFVYALLIPPVADADGDAGGVAGGGGTEAELAGDTVPGGLGVTVTVTVGAGRGRIEILALCRGTWTTTPTTPREVKLTAGRTIAVWVSAPALEFTETIVPTGTPGTWGLSPTEA